jgi:hypothetical protein
MIKDSALTLEDHFENVFRSARIVVTEMNACAFPANARDAGFIKRSLASLENGCLLSESADGTLSALRKMLRQQIRAETLEVRRVFDGYHDPDFGDVGRVLDIPLLTDRGEMLAAMLTSLESLITARHTVLDRLHAERELRKRI